MPTTTIANCPCCQKHSGSGIGSGIGSGSATGVSLACCPDPIPRQLYATITFTGILIGTGSCGCISTTVRLTYGDTAANGVPGWAGEFFWCGIPIPYFFVIPANQCAFYIAFSSSGGPQTCVPQTRFTPTCSPFSFSVTGVHLFSANSCPCPAAGTSTANITVTE